MDPKSFSVFILLLVSGLMLFYVSFVQSFEDVELRGLKVQYLEKKLQISSLRVKAAQYELMEFRQAVAGIIPPLLKRDRLSEEKYPVRNLASILVKSDTQAIDHSKAKRLFETGKEKFRQKSYYVSNEIFRKIIAHHSYSVHVVESYFLLLEGHYKLTQWEKALSVIETMVSLFPSSELTGFGLLRMATIYEAQDRVEESIELYKLVIKSFPYRTLASQAAQSLRQVEL